MLLAGCSALPGAGSPAPSVIVVDFGVGKPAPPLEGTSLGGRPFTLAAERGHPVVVNFWASWCIPCREEFPLFKAALQQDAGQGLIMVGVLFNDDPAPARTFIAAEGADWPTLTDPSGATAKAYRVVAPPQTFFIDREGVVRQVQVGQVADAAELGHLLSTILG